MSADQTEHTTPTLRQRALAALDEETAQAEQDACEVREQRLTAELAQLITKLNDCFGLDPRGPDQVLFTLSGADTWLAETGGLRFRLVETPGSKTSLLEVSAGGSWSIVSSLARLGSFIRNTEAIP